MVNWDITISVVVGGLILITIISLVNLMAYAYHTHKFRNAWWRFKSLFK